MEEARSTVLRTSSKMAVEPAPSHAAGLVTSAAARIALSKAAARPEHRLGKTAAVVPDGGVRLNTGLATRNIGWDRTWPWGKGLKIGGS